METHEMLTSEILGEIENYPVTEFSLSPREKNEWLKKHYHDVWNDPVTGEDVKVYRIPMAEVYRAGKAGQPRVLDSKSKDVTDIFDSFLYKGQTSPICVEYDGTRGKFIILWGNTRYRAMLRVLEGGHIVPGLEFGFIKIFEWPEHIPSEMKPDYQAKENNMKDPHSPALLEDNLATLTLAKIAGKLSDTIEGEETFYSMLSDLQRKESVRKYAKEFLPVWSVGKKFTKLWNAWQKDDADTNRSRRAWEKSEMREWVNIHNKFGVQIPKWEGKDSGGVAQIGDKLVKMYFHSSHSKEYSASFEHGVNVAKYHKKNADETLVDEIWVVASLNGVTRSQIEKTRETCASRYKNYPSELSGVKYIDRLFWMPQTDDEWEDEKNKGLFAGQIQY
jgi:hypothetical protein|tara:strand:+ start:1672 stop:2841 length:1170 start_codon:yes stop_codon:yes gene_type:complete